MNPPEFEWDLLLDQIEAGKVIPVLGQGVMVFNEDGGAESLDQLLAKALAKSLGISNKLPDESFTLQKVICSYPPFRGNQLLAQTKLRAVYQSLFKEVQKSKVPETLRWLADIREFHLFVSLTIDELLEKSIENVRNLSSGDTVRLANAQKGIPDVTTEDLKSPKPIVFRLFGQISKGTDFAFTDEDILEFLHHMQSPDGRPKRLFQEFRENHLLLIGTGFPDWQALFFLRATRGERLRKDREYIDFIVEPNVSDNARLGAFLSNYAAPTTLFYQMDPVAFVKELHERWKVRDEQRKVEANVSSKKPAREVEVQSKPEIFISYSGEDRDAAHIVYNLLIEAKLDVWMDDRGGLTSGNKHKRVINRAISECACFIALLSKKMERLTETFFREEWDRVLERDRKFTGSSFDLIHPVLLDDIDITADFLPEAFAELTFERAPGGNLTPAFVSKMVREVRRYQGNRK